jgi:hypothetical protein
MMRPRSAAGTPTTRALPMPMLLVGRNPAERHKAAPIGARIAMVSSTEQGLNRGSQEEA